VELMGINLAFVMGVPLIATLSPGPGTLTIANSSMQNGKSFGFSAASGVTTGSVVWSATAALGLSAIMLANQWLFEALRYVGAAYLLYVSVRAFRAAFGEPPVGKSADDIENLKSAFLQGLAIHLANPKVILAFGSVYSVAIPPESSIQALFMVVFLVGVQSALVFFSYAFLFSRMIVVEFYRRSYKWMELAFAIAFALAGFSMFLF